VEDSLIRAESTGKATGTRERKVVDDATGNDHAIPSATGTIARLAYARAKAAGVALEPLVKGANLTFSQIEDPRARIKVRDQIQFLNLVADALGDEFLGFHLAQVPDLRELGLLYYVLASADTLSDALQRAARYSSILNEGISLKHVHKAHCAISLHYVGVNRHPDRHQMEFMLTAIVRISRQLTGRHVVPSRLQLIHFRKNHTAEFVGFFGGDIQFGAPTDEITFPTKFGALPIVSADPYLHKLLVTYCEEALSKRPERGSSFRSSVENAVAPLLPHGKARAPEIARRLGVGQRTFARRLSVEGLTFTDLLARLRFDLANRYLADKQLSISQIAWLLGYEEVANFSHAFKRWSGKTPREMRGHAAC
jgi:AraC-like DNA-binding protein